MRSNRRSGAPLRPVDWIAAQSRAVLNAYQFGNLSQCDWVISPLEVAAQFTNPTLMATRMKTMVNKTDGIGASFASQNLMGVGLIEWMAADDILPAVCPDVFLDADFDWIIRQVWPIAGGVVEYQGEVFFDDEYKSSAKRRLETGSGILVVFTNENVSGAFQSDIRCLIKE